MKRSRALILGLMLTAAGIVVGGCRPVAPEDRELRDRYLRRALAAKEEQQIDRAIALCEKALARRPKLARAHLELALMLDHVKDDHLTALVHYQRYLALRPDSPQRKEVEGLIRKCQMTLASEWTDSPAEIRRELRTRDERIRKLEQELARLSEPAGAPPASPAAAKGGLKPLAPAPAAPLPAPTGRVHVVQAGETLATISLKYYGNAGRWKTIYDANRDQMRDPNNLRVGIRLNIPGE